MNKVLPQENKSQEIGKKAGRAFRAKLPDSWSESDLSGDTDFGIDFLVQVKNVDGLMTANFYLQLKGTSSPKFVSEEKEISYQFDASTLNYYRKSEPAIMVAIADMSVSVKPRNCPVYYKWLDEDFLDSISDRLNEKDKVSIRVPIINEINEELDVLPYYKSRLASRDSLINLRRAVEEHSTTPSKDIDALAKAVKEKPVLLDVSRDDTGAPWISNPKDHVAGKLKHISKEISANRIQIAKELIQALEINDTLSNHEKAELLSLDGTTETLLGRDEQANNKYEEAFNILPESRYKLYYYESSLRLNPFPDDNVLEDFITNLESSNLQECISKAKCLTILKRKNIAIKELNKHPTNKTLIAKLLVYTIAGDDSGFNDIISNVNIDNLNDRQIILYYSLVGRRLFFKGINSDKQETSHAIIPAKGKKEYNIDLLKKSFEYIKKALEHTKDLGYPYETYILLDIANSLYSIFNREKDLIVYLEDILLERPSSLPLIEALIPLKHNTHKYNDVIKLIESIENKSPEHISYLISSHYHSGRKTDVVSLLDKHKELLLINKPENYKILFCIAAQCAYEIINEAKEKEFLSYVSDFDEGQELLAIYEYIKLCVEFPEKRKVANKKLYKRYLELGNSVYIAQQLFCNLDFDDPYESSIIPSLADSILSVRELYPDEYLAYGFSLLYNKGWGNLLLLCDKVEKIKVLDNLWILFKASALDGIGRSKDALDLLDGMISVEKRSIERAEHYVNLCVRLGFFEKAQVKLEELLERSPPDKQSTIIESLIFIYSADSEPSSRLIPTLIRYGKIVDQDDEIQEGRYLLSFLIMTNRPDIDVSEYIDNFRDRLSKYTEKYPNSSILKRGDIPRGSRNDDVIKEIHRLAGISEEQTRIWKKNRNLIKFRKLPVPFALLSGFLDDVSDIFYAWILCKYWGHNKKEYQLVHSIMMNDEELNEVSINRFPIIIDETSLLTLNDLGILEAVLTDIDGIVLNKTTYESFSKSSHAVMGSIYSSIPKNILKTLGSHLDKITLKGDIRSEKSLINQYEEILKDLEPSVICTDDLYMSEYLKLSKYKSLNSSNIIEMLYKKGTLSNKDRVISIEKLCSFGLANIAINNDQIISAIDYYMNSTFCENIMDSGFKNIFSAIFTEEKDPYTSLVLLSSIFSDYLNRYNSDIKIDGLEGMIIKWMILYPVLTQLKIISIWFVFACVNTKYIPENKYSSRGKGQSKLWHTVKKLTVESNTKEYTLPIIMTSISESILKLTPQAASDIYDNIKKSFTEDSSESELFTRIYSTKAIEQRISEKKN
jgi:hypothetical protein